MTAAPQSFQQISAIDLVERLRMNAEMLKDGHQENLTKLWHSDVVRDAAADALEAASEIEALKHDLDRHMQIAADSVNSSGDVRAAVIEDLRTALIEARQWVEGSTANVRGLSAQAAAPGETMLAKIDRALSQSPATDAAWEDRRVDETGPEYEARVGKLVVGRPA